MKKRYQGDGFEVTEEDGIYRMSWEQGPFGVIKEYEISKENFEKAMKSSKDAYEVAIFAVTGSWPSSGIRIIKSYSAGKNWRNS